MGKGKYKRKRDNARQKAEKKTEEAALMKEENSHSNEGKYPVKNADKDPRSNQRPSWRRHAFARTHHWLRDGKSFTDWCIAVFTCVLAGAAIWQFIVMGRQLDEMQTQRRLSVRPWVGLDDDLSQAIQNGPLRLDKDGNAEIGYKIIAKNYGTVAASNVWGAAELVVADDLNVALERQDAACGDALVGKKELGMVLFQGKDRIFSGSTAITKVEIRNGGSSIVWVWLIGCIGYRDQFGYLYRTAFRARMADETGTKDIYWQGAPKGQLIATGRFVLEWGGIDAGSVAKF